MFVTFMCASVFCRHQCNSREINDMVCILNLQYAMLPSTVDGMLHTPHTCSNTHAHTGTRTQYVT